MKFPQDVFREAKNGNPRKRKYIDHKKWARDYGPIRYRCTKNTMYQRRTINLS